MLKLSELRSLTAGAIHYGKEFVYCELPQRNRLGGITNIVDDRITEPKRLTIVDLVREQSRFIDSLEKCIIEAREAIDATRSIVEALTETSPHVRRRLHTALNDIRFALKEHADE